MSAFYDRMSATALQLLTNYGRTIQLNRTVDGEYDPDTGTSGGTVETQDATVVILPAVTELCRPSTSASRTAR